jgi:transcription factor E
LNEICVSKIIYSVEITISSSMKKKISEASGNYTALGDFLGEEVAELARELSRQDDYSEFKLAEALKREVNETRNLLYKLHNLNLASFTKKKDNKVGWYIYYWTFHDERVENYVLNEKKGQLENLKEISSRREGQNYFACKNRCLSLDFDRSFEFSFRCPECGELLEQEDNSKRETQAPREIQKLETQIKKLQKTKKINEGKNKEENEEA